MEQIRGFQKRFQGQWEWHGVGLGHGADVATIRLEYIYERYDVALKYIDGLNREKFAGYDDWRLPTVEELASLIEPEKMKGELKIDPIFNEKQWVCWSADKSSSGPAWAAKFDLGVVFSGPINDGSFVRAVRSGQ